MQITNIFKHPTPYPLFIISEAFDVIVPSRIQTWDLRGCIPQLNLRYWCLRPLGNHGRSCILSLFLLKTLIGSNQIEELGIRGNGLGLELDQSQPMMKTDEDGVWIFENVYKSGN